MRSTMSVVLFGALALTGCGQKKDQNQAGAPAPVSPEEEAQLDEQFAQIPTGAIVRVPVNETGETTGAPEMRTVADASSLETADGTAAAFDGGAAPQKMVKGGDELDGNTSTQSWTAYDNYQGGYGTGGTQGGTYPNGGNQGGTYPNGGNQGGGYPDGGNQGGGYPDGGNQGGGYDGGNQGGGYGGGNNGGSYGGGSYGGGCGNYCGGWGHNYWYNNYKPVLYYGHNKWNYGYTRPNYYHHGGYRYYCYRPHRWW